MKEIEVNELRREIDLLTLDILKLLREEQIEHANELLGKRLELIKKLAAMHTTKEEIELLRPYLIQFYQREQEINQFINEQRKEIQTALSNLNKVVKYTTS